MTTWPMEVAPLRQYAVEDVFVDVVAIVPLIQWKCCDV